MFLGFIADFDLCKISTPAPLYFPEECWEKRAHSKPLLFTLKYCPVVLFEGVAVWLAVMFFKLSSVSQR